MVCEMLGSRAASPAAAEPPAQQWSRAYCNVLAALRRSASRFAGRGV